MIIKKYPQHTSRLLLPIALMLTSSNAFCANFSIAPTYPLPHSMSLGQQVAAYYTITNKTSSPRIGYTIKGLPVGVTQIINATPGSCQALISLNSNQSCSLQLLISSAVNSNFALCKGDSCTSASEPLSLSIGYAMVAAGGYSNGTANFPLLATSSDNGSSWSYKIDDSHNAPTGNQDGSFYSTNSSSPSLLPSSLKNLLDNDSSFSDKPPIRDNRLMRKSNGSVHPK